jgi:hypothetical protein
MEGLVRAAALTDFAEVSCSLGYDAAAALRAGLSPRVLDEPEMRLPAGVVMQLLETAARATNCDTFGLRMAQSRQVSNFGAISLLLTHLGTLRDVLTTTIEHLHLLNSALALQVEENGPLVIVREEVMSASLARQSVELAIGVIYRLCATLMGKGWHPRSVNFSHGAPASGALHRQVFQCPVIFDAEFNGLVPRGRPGRAQPGGRPEPGALCPRPAGEPAAVQPAHPQPRRAPHHLPEPALGRRHLRLGGAKPGRSLRTFQRELDQEGVSFSELLAEVRTNLARRYMESPKYEVGQVAALLGTAHGAFTRWFALQFGLPTEWRRRAMALEPSQDARTGAAVPA